MKTLITCHANADCDAFAAMLAARRLYQSCVLLFPGTQEPGLNKVFSNLDKEKYNFIDIHNINWEEIEKLVIVDTRQANRCQHIAQILNKEGLEIEIWDHHPPSSDDISTGVLNYGSAGSSTTLLCQELQKRGVTLTAEEATLLGLGIYGDTGSFTYSSTTREDFLAAAWLLGQGMDVTRINDMACHELTSMHINALNNLLESAQTYTINDVPVVIAESSSDHYLGDFAYLAHKLMEMEKFQVLFAIGIMGDRIQVVARSRNDAINVGEICEELGGGGHMYAASASLRYQAITEVREKILRCLYAQANPEKTARDYMSSPVIGIDTETTINKADELMLHFGLKAVPVFQPGTRSPKGILDAQTAARANAHGLGSEPVKEYMQHRIATLPPDAKIKDLTDIIVNDRQRLVPITENNIVIGVVTRTDIINVFANKFNESPFQKTEKEKKRNVQKLITDRLPPETREILKLAGSVGSKLGLPVYAVGGFVRDLLLDHPNQDIDLVAEGNGIAFARALAKELGGRVRTHEKFLTSVVIYHDAEGTERHIDVATARLEYYEYPAALPSVEVSSIKMDLFRRDFSINTLAIRLDSDQYGQLIDFFGGQRDIKDKIIRVLHTLSFVEDPTRCIRAVRFEQRYKFKIGPGTEKLIKNILPLHLLEKLSPQRIFNEFKHICEEDTGAECIIRMDELGILKALGLPKIANPRIALLKMIKKILNWYKLLFYEEKIQPWLCYFLVICHHNNYFDTSRYYQSLGLPETRKNDVMREREKMRKLRPQLIEWQKNYDKGKIRVSKLYELLEGSSIEFLLYTMAAVNNPGLEKNISRYITQWRRTKADINGNDLHRLGIEPGPVYGMLLKYALLAKLDGKAPNAKSQLSFVQKQLKTYNAQTGK